MKSKSVLGRASGKTETAKTQPRRQTGQQAENFSRLLAVDDVPDAGLEVTLRADEPECAAIARSNGLVAVAALGADLVVTRLAGARINVKGALRARVSQTCVISLDPFETDLQAELDVDFAPGAAIAKATGAAAAEIEEGYGSAEPFGLKRDPPDPIIDGVIDLGALVEEFLVLSLNPYPRKPGVSFDETGVSGDPIEKPSPFEILKKLKKER